jgi:DNA invertase Pin-like site-specific DNA recombinase
VHVTEVKMSKFITYCRVSTRSQGESGLGLSAQQRDIQLYLQNYTDSGYQVLGEYTEVESGTNSERPVLRKAIAVAKASGAKLLIAKLDRLSRKVSFISSLLEDKALQLVVAQMPNADKFQLHIYAALAEQERDFISKRTKAALAEAKANGVKLGGLRDKTNARNKKLSLLATERAERTRKIIEPMLIARLPLREMAASLNAAGLRTVRGSEYQATTVHRIISRLGLAALKVD